MVYSPNIDIKDLKELVIGCAITVHKVLKNFYVEQVYKKALSIELRKHNIPHELEKKIDIYYEGELIGQYRADIIVDKRLILELKAVNELVLEHSLQLVNYLKTTGIDHGLLINFGNFYKIKVIPKRRDNDIFYPIVNRYDLDDEIH